MVNHELGIFRCGSDTVDAFIQIYEGHYVDFGYYLNDDEEFRRLAPLNSPFFKTEGNVFEKAWNLWPMLRIFFSMDWKDKGETGRETVIFEYATDVLERKYVKLP